jgi:nucleotide-binding universal stress UspA family protein
MGRVALLPLTGDVRLTLLHVVPKSLPILAQRLAERDARKALAAEVSHLAKSLPRNATIEATVKIGVASKEIAACARSVKAELIVMGRGSRRAFRDVFLGSTAERVIRRGPIPVLVVRLRPRAAYGRPALALDFDQAAHAALDLVFRMLPAPRPQVAIVHAFDAPYPRLAYPSLSKDAAKELKRELQSEASHKLAKLVGPSLRRARGESTSIPIRTHIRYGSARTAIEKAVKQQANDLLVLGTRGYPRIAYMFLGTVAGDVLREVQCDVLVVPPPRHSKRDTL